MSPVSRKTIIEEFMKKAKKERNMRSGFEPGLQSALIFIYCWISFEAFTCFRYNEDAVWKRIDRFCSEFKDRYSQWYDVSPGDFKGDIIALKKYAIHDMRPNHQNNPPKQITDEKKLRNVFEVIYSVRCNLFHGGKDVTDTIDADIIRYSSGVLYFILEHFLIAEGYSW